MKKHFTLFFILTISIITYAQSTHTIDFEPAGIGADWTWTVSDNADNPSLEFIANPVSGGINTSATVAKFIAREAGNNWALFFTNDDGEFTFDATNSTVKLMVYKSTISNVAFKVEGATGAPTELKVANTLTDQWEELTFDFSSLEGQKYSRLVIIPDFVEPYVDGTDRTSENILYIDNIQVPDGVEVGPLPAPTLAAPVPTQLAANVISVYSDAYNNLSGTNFNPGWGQSTTVTVDELIDGDNTLLYEGLNYQGTEYSSQDVSGFDYLHVDFWTPNSTRLDFFLISPGNETSYSLPISLESWVSVDIPLSSFVPPVDLTDVFQFKLDGNGTIHFDNLYFWKDVSTDVSSSSADAISVFPNPATDILRINGVKEGAIGEIYNAAGALVQSSMVSGGYINMAKLNTGMYFLKVSGITTKVIKK